MLSTYEQILDHFRTTDLYRDMSTTVENSPYHREASVAVHTEMVIQEYRDYIHRVSTLNYRCEQLGFFACLLHDIGKPSSQITKHSAERGDYLSFTGHEQRSARLAETFLLTYYTQRFSPREVAVICFLIEQHKPWDIVDRNKISAIVSTIAELANISVDEARELYAAVLYADQAGRTPDDPIKHLEHTTNWINEYIYQQLAPAKNTRAMYVLIGASGSGKSTWTKHFKDVHGQNRSIKVWSLDEMRLRYYNPSDYALAFQASTNDNTFARRANAELEQMCRDKIDSIIIDNTNVSKKSRAGALAMARRYGYTTVAVYFTNTIDTVISRQRTQPDKSVPLDAVERQYNSTQLPSLEEFDEVTVV